MKGDERLIRKLDELLSDKWTAVHQYMVHSEMCANWGYDRLHQAVEDRARQEMHHAEALLARIIFLGGTPTVNRLNRIHIGADVPRQLLLDRKKEAWTNRTCNEALRLADEADDDATRDLLESIVEEENGHLDWLDEQINQISRLGVPLYLSTQTKLNSTAKVGICL